MGHDTLFCMNVAEALKYPVNISASRLRYAEAISLAVGKVSKLVAFTVDDRTREPVRELFEEWFDDVTTNGQSGYP